MSDHPEENDTGGVVELDVAQPNSVLPLETFVQNAWGGLEQLDFDVNAAVGGENATGEKAQKRDEIEARIPEAVSNLRSGLDQAEAELQEAISDLEAFVADARRYLDKVEGRFS